MTKSNHQVTLIKSERGQISIFFSASLVVMITIVAFVINIGLFVKAKINLQNATDAAAYAGASVQARQLSKIAYLNWEMRNIYKEWLYKYYVIGNLNIKDVESPGASGVMQFKLREDKDVLSGVDTADQFNIPTVCIHIAGSKTNICKRYSIPGLPEFGSSNLPGAEEASRAFLDTLISTKVNDCIDRTRLNMLVANTWTYNVLGNSVDESLAGKGPAILADRQGAWPRAVELAIRIRNLERIMNRPAETSGICSGGSTELTRCSKSITDIEQENNLGNERIVKAFYSGYRNLGNEDDNEMKQSFTLSEIPPKEVSFDQETDASNLLIPVNQLSTTKQWVDLKLMMVNYAIFYAAMIPRADSSTSGACDVSKVAIPVPGYPLGFYKNPDVVTYYAVKGEAEFVGMFSPFRQGSVKLQTYAAAKPFGGRIGPMLFTQKENQIPIIGRTDNQKLRSVPYITSYDFRGTVIRGKTYDESGGRKFIPGLPLPTNSTESPGAFWLEDPDKPIGGKIAKAEEIQFGVPNLVYDYENDFRPDNYTLSDGRIFMIKSSDPSSEKSVGLFSRFQFNKFRGSAVGGIVSTQTLDEEIARVRAPTIYEAANYLIPTPYEFNTNYDIDSFGFITSAGPKDNLSNGYERYDAYVYAPLFGQGLLFDSATTVQEAIFKYMTLQEPGMKKYLMALNRAADNIWDERKNIAGGAEGSIPGYERAARGVSDITFPASDLTEIPKTCDSLAGQFLYFYYGGLLNTMAPNPSDPDALARCPKPLKTLFEQYFSMATTDEKYNPAYYSFRFSWPKDMSKDEGVRFMTAYMPGPFTGVNPNGEFVNPIPGSGITDTMRRNTYSTKFIRVNSVRPSGNASYDNKGFAIMSEGTVNESGSLDTSQKNFKNPLDPNVIGEDVSSLNY